MPIYIAEYITSDDYDVFTTSSEVANYEMNDFLGGFSIAAGTSRDRVMTRALEALVNDLVDREDLRAATSDPAIQVYNEEREEAIKAGKLVPNPVGDNTYNFIVKGEILACMMIREFEEA